MKGRGLLVATVILAALVGALYWSSHRKAPESSDTFSASASPKILTLNGADISRIEIRKKGAPAMTVAKDPAGQWQITAPRPLRADASEVSGVVSTLASLVSDRLVEEKAGDLRQYGLAQPTLEVQITEKSQKTWKLLVGDDTPTGGGAYAKLDGDPRVFTIASYTKSSFDKGPADLRDKRLLTVDPDTVSRVQLATKKQDIEFGRNKNEWQILKPAVYRADNSKVEDLVRALTDAKMELDTADPDNRKAAAAFAAGTRVAKVKVTGASGAQDLEVRKQEDDYYAKSSAAEGVYKVSRDLGQQLDKGLDDFRNKKLFDFGFADPEKIELRDAAKTVALTKSGEDWVSNGAKMDATSAQSFVDQIRELSTSKFADSGFTTPVIEITATSNQGKHVEKVLIAKNAKNYVAMRPNEAGLYELDSSVVGALQKSADGLKPAALPKK